MPEFKQEPPPREGPERKCIGLRETIVASSRERRDKPHPWILQKIMIPVVLAITGYAYYVYAVRMCIPMVRRKTRALGSRKEGIAFLIIFHVLLVIALWAYAKVVFTPAGLARDHIPKCPPPEARSRPEYEQSGSYMSYPTTIGGPEYAPSEQSRVPSLQNEITMDTANEAPQTPPLDAGVESPAQAYARSHSSRWRVSQAYDNVDHLLPNGAAGNEVVEMGAIPIVTDDDQGRNHDPTSEVRPHPSRHPPSHPALSPEYRYCPKDEIIKPPRTHHCRICGTCVLMFDHHCPWIGQCVGAGNRRLFFLLCVWGFLFTSWMAVTLLIANVSHTNLRDAQGIGMIFVAALFSLFTGSLAINHFILIRYNSTTVEDLSLNRMRNRERAELNNHFGICQRREKRELRRQWDEEWGRLGTETNLWWLGNARANWEAMMGRNPSYWIFPIGGSFTDGLDFPRNPRFSEDGRWRRRAEWPEDV